MDSIQSFYKNKRVLVTGGAGFIGSHLVEKLVNLGAQVTVLDNFSSGVLTNLKSVVGDIFVIYGDVRSAYTCLKATENKDIVFHLASFVSVPQSIVDPITCYNINVNGTNNILEGCRKNAVKAFVFSTSSAVYGDKDGVSCEDDSLNPTSPYAISKVKGEEACKLYATNFAMNIACLRYFNVYGERQKINGPYAAVVATFTQQLKTNQTLTIYGDGKQTRDFIHVSRVVDANILVATKSSLQGDIFNIASGKSMNLLQLIETLKKDLCVQQNDTSFMPARQGDIVHSQASIKKYTTLANS